MMNFSRKIFPAEVIQVSSMDCGPASLKSLLQGFKLKINYSRLREVCQTNLDGTSIDTLEQVAKGFGFFSEQSMLPANFLFNSANRLAPGILVVLTEQGNPHFVVFWRQFKRWAMIMDPASGTKILTLKKLEAMAFRHTLAIPAEDFEEWSLSKEFFDYLTNAAILISVSPREVRSLIDTQIAEGKVMSQVLVTLDAAIRFISYLKKEKFPVKQVRSQARRIENILNSALNSPSPMTIIPKPFWYVVPDAHEPENFLLHGFVYLRVRPKNTKERADISLDEDSEIIKTLQHSLPEPSIAKYFLEQIGHGRSAFAALLIPTVVLMSTFFLIESFSLRSIVEVAENEFSIHTFLIVTLMVIIFSIAMSLVELPIVAISAKYGRHLEFGLRMKFLKALPNLSQQFVNSRNVSDLVERCHNIFRIRQFPLTIVEFSSAASLLIVNYVGIIVISGQLRWSILLLGAFALFFPWLTRAVLASLDLKIKSINGVLSTYYLDFIQGSILIKNRRIRRSLMDNFDRSLFSWVEFSGVYLRRLLFTEFIQRVCILFVTYFIIKEQFNAEVLGGTLLLLFLWCSNLSTAAKSMSDVAQSYTSFQNFFQRAIEPVNESVQEEKSQNSDLGNASEETKKTGYTIVLKDIQVVAAGKTILEEINLNIAANEHIAVIGRSGAGKSSFVGIFTGSHYVNKGEIFIDETPYDSQKISVLCKDMAIVAPQIYLFKDSIMNNLLYKERSAAFDDFKQMLSFSDVQSLSDNFEGGLNHEVGDAGRRLSGGEAQRLRIGRGMLSSSARLVLLDEMTRGIEKKKYLDILKNARQLWHNSTLIYITHDMEAVLTFDRVIVFGEGKIIEDGKPQLLIKQIDSAFYHMFQHHLQKKNWAESDGTWKRMTLENQEMVIENV